MKKILALAALFASTFSTIPVHAETVTLKPIVIVGHVKHPKGKRWECKVETLEQGSGVVRYCHWVKK